MISQKANTWHEWDEQIALLSEGQHPKTVVRKAPVMTLVDSSGKATDYSWNPNPPSPEYKGMMIQKIYLTGQYHPFAIQNFDGGDICSGERTWYSVFPSWNHWPTSQVNSSGLNVSRLSFGASALGGVYGKVDEAEGIRAGCVSQRGRG